MLWNDKNSSVQANLFQLIYNKINNKQFTHKW